MVAINQKDVQAVVNNIRDIYKIENKDGNSLVYFCNGVVLEINTPPYSLLQLLCIQFGSTLEGRAQAISKIMKIRQKLPVLVSLIHHVIFFPTLGIANEDCIWVSANNCLYAKYKDDANSTILLIDGSQIVIPVNYRVLRQQLNRCQSYLKFLKK